MFSSSLIQLCRSLPKQDLNALKKVVRSPYFNVREEVVRLLDYVADCLGKEEILLDRKLVFRSVFPGQKEFDMAALQRVVSLLMDTIRQYLAIEEMKADGSQSRVYLNLAFKHRGMEEFRLKELPKALAENEKQPLRDLQYHYRQCVMNWEGFDISLMQRWENTPEFESMAEQQSYYLLTKIIKLGCLGAVVENRTGEQHDIMFLDEAIRYVEREDLFRVPAIAVFYHVYKCLRGQDSEAHAQTLRQLLAEHSHKFSGFDLRFVMLALTNFHIQKYLVESDIAPLRESFDLYLSALENQIWMPNKVLSKYTFFNFVAQGLALEKTDWVQQFIKDYQKYLPEADRENAVKFHLALWHFHCRDFDTALALLQKVILHDELLFNLEARGIMTSIYFDTKAFDVLSYHLDNYNVFVRRHPETGLYRASHLNFIAIVKKMLNLKPGDAKAVEQLRAKIRDTRQLRARAWLLERVG